MYSILFFGSDEVEVLMTCESEADAYEMVLSFVDEYIYELWFDENHNPDHLWGEIPPTEYANLKSVFWDYFVIKNPYCPIFMERK
jgi:hypothetical protein